MQDMEKAHLHFRSPSLLLLLLLLLQHVLAAAAARHLGSCSSHHSLPSFSPSLPPPLARAPLPLLPNLIASPVSPILTFCHSRAHGHVTSGAAPGCTSLQGQQ